LLFGIVVVVGVLAVAGAWLLRLEPVAWGSVSGPGTRLFLGAQELPDPDDGRVLTYRWVPGGRFDVYLGLQNDGPLPITVLGTGQSPDDASPYGFRVEDLAQARTSQDGGDKTDPITQPSLAPTTLAPGDRVEIWARYVIGTGCNDQVPWSPVPGWPEGDIDSTSTQEVPINFEVLGIPRTMRVGLPFAIQMVNGGPDAIETCPVG